MAEPNQALALDRAQVKKAVLALQAFLNSKSTSEALFLNQTQPISLLFTLWKIPKKPQNLRIPLPHNQRTETDEVCLFTRDEPSMTPDQTQRFYKRLLQENGISSITEVIPYKVLKTEYKSIESKRRLIANFDLFLSDDRIQRLLPSHLGKNFYKNKKDPIPVNLQSKHLCRDLKSVIHGMRMKINNKGPCCMASIGHSGMTSDDLIENVEAAVKAVTEKMRTKGPVMKLIHLKSLASVALPVYSADLSHLAILEEAQKLEKPSLKRKKPAKKAPAEADGNDEEIPQLVPIETPVKKAKLEKPPKNAKKPVLEAAPKATGKKRAPRKRPHKLTAQKKTPKPSAQTKTPKPSAQTKSPKPSAQTKTPKPSAQTKTPKPSAQTKTAKPSAQTKTPKPSAQTKTAKPASQKKSPKPASQKKSQNKPTKGPGKATSGPRRKGKKAK